MITLPTLRRAPSVNRVAVNRSRQELRAFELLHVLPANRKKKRADERTRTADLTSLGVIIRALQVFARACNSRISRRFSLLQLAPCCTVLRSRWCQEVQLPSLTLQAQVDRNLLMIFRLCSRASEGAVIDPHPLCLTHGPRRPHMATRNAPLQVPSLMRY